MGTMGTMGTPGTPGTIVTAMRATMPMGMTTTVITDRRRA